MRPLPPRRPSRPELTARAATHGTPPGTPRRLPRPHSQAPSLSGFPAPTSLKSMADSHIPPRQLYLAWVEEQIEEHKARLPREELMQLADEAVQALYASDDGQYPLTEILLRDAVDALIFERLKLPSYRVWLRRYRSEPPGGRDVSS